MTSLAHLLQPGQVTFLEAGDREQAVAAREELASTVLECGVAVPHCHVRLLASIASVCERPDLAEQLSSAETAEAVVDLLTSPVTP